MKKNPSLVKDGLLAILILGVATGLSFSMRHFDIRTENILLIYAAAVLFIEIETKRLGIAVLSALACLLMFDFFFIEPYYTLRISDPSYWISIAVFFLVTLTASTLTSNLARQIDIAGRGERRSVLLNRMNTALLNADSFPAIVKILQETLREHLGRAALVTLSYGEETVFGPETADREFHREKIDWTLAHRTPCGAGHLYFPESRFLYLPLAGRRDAPFAGTVILEIGDRPLAKADESFVETAMASLLLACDRRVNSLEREKASLQVEREKLKSSLLRSLSHDIRTPLTSISTGASLLMDNFEEILPEERRKMLSDINAEALFLSDFVTNLLLMTNIDAGHLEIEKHRELLEEVFSEIGRRVENQLGSHVLSFSETREDDFVEADRQLLLQVFLNLVGNAIAHTRPDSRIRVEAELKADRVVFRVSDNGGGIDPKRLPALFEEWSVAKSGKADRHRGMGIGLSIAKAIVCAHGGDIDAANNAEGGATFTFWLPRKREEGSPS